MGDLPSKDLALQRLLGSKNQLAPLAKAIVPAKEVAQQAASQAPDLTCAQTLSEIRDQILAVNGEAKVGHLLSKYALNRDRQMATLSGVGRDVLLSIMAQGILPAEIARGLEVSYDIFTEFMRLTCSVEEIKYAEQLSADSMIAESLADLDKAVDRDDVAKARAILDAKWKIAKSMNSRYIEQKPTTAVQVNNYNEAPSEGEAYVPFLQIIEPRTEDLPPLKPHVAQPDKAQQDSIIPTEYTIIEG